MIEIPEHLLERSRAARARLTGEAAPEADEPQEGEAGAPVAEEEAATVAAPEAEPVAAEPVEAEPVTAEEPEAAPSAASTEVEPAVARESLPVFGGTFEPLAVLAPIPVVSDQPFVDFAFSSAPDSAARRHLVAAAAWLAVASLASVLPALQLVAPGFLGGSAVLNYGRLLPATQGMVLFGWLSLSAMSAMFFITPRLCGTRLFSEPLAHAALWLMQLGLLLGAGSVLAGLSTGQTGLEFPLWAAVPIEAAFLCAAISVVGTILLREERYAYVSLLYFAAASPFSSLLYAVGNAPGFTGVSRAIVTTFFSQNVVGLWVGAAAIGAAYYVVPRVTGNPLFSRRLALVGFWSLAFLHVWVGAARLVYGPAPDWLETVAVAFAVTLLVPAVTVAINLAGTMRRRWFVLAESPSAKFVMAGSGFLVLGTFAYGVGSVRSFSEVLGFTSFPDGTTTLLLLGAFSMFLFSFAYYALPRMSGRQWLSTTASSVHFWLTGLGVAVTVIALWGGGLV